MNFLVLNKTAFTRLSTEIQLKSGVNSAKMPISAWEQALRRKKAFGAKLSQRFTGKSLSLGGQNSQERFGLARRRKQLRERRPRHLF
jgi:hypothetical protein